MLYVLSILKDNHNLVHNGVMSENSFLLLPPFPTCCVVNWCMHLQVVSSIAFE